MTASSAQAKSSCLPRRRDRRVAFAEVLASLSRTLDPRSDPALLRTTFEEGLRQTLPVRSVQLRDGASWRPERVETAIGVDTVIVDVPVGEAAFPAVPVSTKEARRPRHDPKVDTGAAVGAA